MRILLSVMVRSFSCLLQAILILVSDLAIALLRLFERQTWSADDILKQHPLDLYWIALIFCHVPTSCQQLVPSLCAVVLAQLRPFSHEEQLRPHLSEMASWILYVIGKNFDPVVSTSMQTGLRGPPGIEIMLALAEFAVELHPSSLDCDEHIVLEARKVFARLYAISNSARDIPAHASGGPQDTMVLPPARDEPVVSERLKSLSTPSLRQFVCDPALGGTESLHLARLIHDAGQEDPVATRSAAPTPRPYVTIEMLGAGDARLDSTRSVAPPSESATPRLFAAAAPGPGKVDPSTRIENVPQ